MEGKNKILLVDDDPDILATYEELLKNLPSKPEVLTADSGKKAISLMDSNEIDLLICDIDMPGIDGFQVLSIVKKRFPDLRIVVFTALENELYRNIAYGLGVDMCWRKPATQKDAQLFLESIDGLLQQQKGQGFRGVQSKNLVDIIQLECMCGSSVTIKVKSADIEAKIFIKDGEIIDAEIGDLQGEVAFKKILRLKSGAFEILPIVEDRERKIFTSYNGLLLDAAQTMDEILTDDKSQLPDASEVGDRTAFENPLAIIAKNENVLFAMGGDLKNNQITGTAGSGDFNAVHNWITHTMKKWDSLGESFVLGNLIQIQATEPHYYLMVESQAEKYLCVAFKPETKKDSLQELMKNFKAIWIS